MWHFSQKGFENSTLWTQKCFEQHQRVAEQSQYQFLPVSIHTFGHYLPEERLRNVNSAILDLNARYQSREEPEIIKYGDRLIRQLIVLELLVENGGVFIDENAILTEKLDWIAEISNNPDVNARLWVKRPSLVGFHSVELSSPLKFEESYPAPTPTQKYIVLYPAISPYFLAATKNNAFLKDVRDLYYQLLNNVNRLESIFDS